MRGVCRMHLQQMTLQMTELCTLNHSPFSQLIYSLSGKAFFLQSNVFYLVESTRYAMSASRSLFFLRPAKTIFVPGMYFLGFVKYSSRVPGSQVIPLFLLASV